MEIPNVGIVKRDSIECLSRLRFGWLARDAAAGSTKRGFKGGPKSRQDRDARENCDQLWLAVRIGLDKQRGELLTHGGDRDSAFAFTLDSSKAAAPGVALATDSGMPGDKITNVGTLALTAETNAKIEYSIDGGTTWTNGFTAKEGANSVQVRQTDVAGNVSDASAAFAFTFDGTAPVSKADAYVVPKGATLTVSAGQGVLANDTGASTISLVNDVRNGTLTWNPDGRSFTRLERTTRA